MKMDIIEGIFLYIGLHARELKRKRQHGNYGNYAAGATLAIR